MERKTEIFEILSLLSFYNFFIPFFLSSFYLFTPFFIVLRFSCFYISIIHFRGVFPGEGSEVFSISFSPQNILRSSFRAVLMLKNVPQGSFCYFIYIHHVFCCLFINIVYSSNFMNQSFSRQFLFASIHLSVLSFLYFHVLYLNNHFFNFFNLIFNFLCLCFS